MAGSYSHCVDDDGRLLDSMDLAGMLENGGDVYEAVEEMYGMIWWLASRLSEAHWQHLDPAEYVEHARQHYQDGLEISPGTGARLPDDE